VTDIRRADAVTEEASNYDHHSSVRGGNAEYKLLVVTVDDLLVQRRNHCRGLPRAGGALQYI
jgi:hypothetical protein